MGVKLYSGLKSDRVSDSLGSSADGVNTNVTLDTTNEKLGTGCYNFDGSGDKTALGTSTTFSSTLTDGSTDWTIAFWMKLNATEPNGNNAIFCQGQGNEQGLDILFDDRSAESRDHVLGVRMEGVGGHTPLKLYTGAQFIPKDTNWHHYVITADISTRTITAYRDNANAVSDSTGSGTFPSASDLDAPMTFGVHPSGGFGDLNAKLDDCGIWSRILTSDERTSLWNSGNGTLANTISGGLKAYYSFNSLALDVAKTYPSSGVLPTGSTTTDWTLADATISSSNINFNSGQQSTDNRAMYDLGANVSDTKWTLRFKYDISDWASGSNSNIGGFTGIFSSSGNNGATQDGIYLGFYTDSSRNYFVAGAINNGSFEGYTTNSAYYLDTTPSETTYYVEIKRTGASSGEITLYSDSTYETKIGTTHTNFLNGISSSISGLRYVGIKNRYDVPTLGTARWAGTISDIEIYDDTTLVGCKNNASSTSPLEALDGVRTNSIFLETDATATTLSDLASSMILYYNFDETSGVTLNDQVGSVDGELKDGSLVNVDGVVDKAWRFDDTKVQIDQSLGTVSNISLSIWVKKFDDDRCSIAIDSNTSNFGTGLWFEDRDGATYGLRIGHQSSGTDLNTQTRIPNDGEWHHVVFIAGSDEARIYLDGVSIGNNSGTHSSGAYGSALELAYNGSASVYGNCALDEARWFNKKLSQAEVTALYKNPDRFYWWYNGTTWVAGD